MRHRDSYRCVHRHAVRHSGGSGAGDYPKHGICVAVEDGARQRQRACAPGANESEPESNVAEQEDAEPRQEEELRPRRVLQRLVLLDRQERVAQRAELQPPRDRGAVAAALWPELLGAGCKAESRQPLRQRAQV